MNQRRVSRQELYALVWSKPITELAREFGISDVGFAKVCDRLEVPRPGRGYWAKVRRGAKLKKPPLPRRQDGKPTAVDLSPQTNEERAKPRGKPFQVHVSKALRNPHPLVEQSKKLLAGGEPDEFGRLHPPTRQCLAIRVSPKSLDRALRIMDALLKAIEARGRSARIGVGYNKRVETQFLYGDEYVDFEIWEDSSQRILEPTREELIWAKRSGRDPYRRKAYTPTGRLRLQASDAWRPAGPSRVSDSRRTPLEDRVGEFLGGLEAIAAAKERRTREHFIEQERREHERALAEERRRRREHEAENVKALLAAVRNWRDAIATVEFLDALEAAMSDEERSEAADWLGWARARAEEFNPLNAPAEIPQPLEPAPIEEPEERQGDEPYSRLYWS